MSSLFAHRPGASLLPESKCYHFYVLLGKLLGLYLKLVSNLREDLKVCGKQSNEWTRECMNEWMNEWTAPRISVNTPALISSLSFPWQPAVSFWMVSVFLHSSSNQRPPWLLLPNLFWLSSAFTFHFRYQNRIHRGKKKCHLHTIAVWQQTCSTDYH